MCVHVRVCVCMATQFSHSYTHRLHCSSLLPPSLSVWLAGALRLLGAHTRYLLLMLCPTSNLAA